MIRSAASPALPPRRVSVAPMMNRTDRHFRYLMRLITRRTWLYTEMVVARALFHGSAGRLLRHERIESPLALQVGGSDPRLLAWAARLAADHGFEEINLNVGCPSQRVTNGRMGACLMAEPALVGECVAAMKAAAPLAVTVKTRIGIDGHDDPEFLFGFAEAVRTAGCSTLIVHARKAWLKGLDPKANRTVPALDYERVYRLKRFYPELEVVLNGGIESLEAAEEPLTHVDGVMLGRAAYARPLLFAAADARFFAERRRPGLDEVLAGYLDYLARCATRGERLGPALRHLSGLLAGVSGSRRIRRGLAELGGAADLSAIERVLSPLLVSRRAAA